MEQAIKVIKKYAQDSIDYGKKSGNSKALQRGNEIMFAVNKIESEIDKLHNLQKLIITNRKSLLYVEEDFAKRIDPMNYENLEEWKSACRTLRNELA